MSWIRYQLLCVSITLSFFLLTFSSVALDQPQDDQTPLPKEETNNPTPALAEIIPLEIKLSSRLATLRSNMEDLLDVSQVESDFEAFEKTLDGLTDELKQFQESKSPRYSELLELDKSLDNNISEFEDISEPLLLAINQLGNWRMEWLKEKDQWTEWQDSLAGDREMPEIELAFNNVHTTIEDALNLIIPQLDVLLKLQKKGFKNKSRLDKLEADIDELIQKLRQNLFTDSSVSMFSAAFLSQFSTNLWFDVKKGFINIEWPGRRFFKSELWVIILQLIVTILVIVLIYRNKSAIKKTESYAFIARYPVATGLFIGVMTTIVIFQLHKAPGSWDIIITIVGGLSFSRIVSAIKKSSWINQFTYGIMILMIISQLFDIMDLPSPLYRLFLVLISAAIIIFCLRWAAKSKRENNSKHYSWLLYLISIPFLAVILAEIIGEENLAIFLFESMLRTIILFLIFLMIMYLIRGGIERLLRSIIHEPASPKKNKKDPKENQIVFFINAIILIFILLPTILSIWGVYDNMQEATIGLMGLGLTIGAMHLSLGLIIMVAGILYGSYIFSVLIQYSLVNRVLSMRKIDKGARLSINRLIHYIILFVGFMLAISALGFEITKLTIILSALGVGIGFGLQGFVNNFVSGLILLFEQPVREGDSIQVGGVWSTIKKIGLRATRVKTVDEADVIIPNADLVYNQVTNWTLSDRRVRVVIKVGVAYGSDVPKVMKTLLAVAKDNNKIVKDDVTQALFLGFGDSALNFELRVWASEANDRVQVISDLHQDIDNRFREANIEIAFPQLDLHLRSKDTSVDDQIKENKN